MALACKTLAIVVVAALLLLVTPASAASGEPGVHITKMTIEPGGPDFNITVQYSTSFMTKIFSLLFGARVVQPGIVDQVAGLGDVKLASIDTYGQTARLVAKNQSRPLNGMYLYDKGATFPVAVDVLEIAGSAVVEPLVINSTNTVPTFFYRM